jgi:CheY-like chemotaxis protein
VDKVDILCRENTNYYSLIVMDLSMPVMDGAAASKYIRDVLHLPVPIILTTSLLEDDNLDDLIEFALKNGANMALKKPTNPQDFRDACVWLQLFGPDQNSNIPQRSMLLAQPLEPSVPQPSGMLRSPRKTRYILSFPPFPLSILIFPLF